MKRSKSTNVFYLFSTDYAGRSAGGSWQPNVDIYETDAHVVVAVEVAGIPAEDIEVTELPDRLVVKGVRRPPMSGKARRFHQIEIVCGEFEKDVLLSEELRGAAVSATLSLGILYLQIDKNSGRGGQVERKIRIEARKS